MIKSPIRMKSFYQARLFGTGGLFLMELGCIIKKKLCKCLVTIIKNKDGKEVKMYYHKVLETKLVLADNLVIRPKELPL